MVDLFVADIMTTKLVFVDASDSVLNAAKKMVSAGIGNVLVMSDGSLKGILTEKDLLAKVVATNSKPDSFKVGDIMTKKVVTTRPSVKVQDVARVMIDEGIHRLPVKDKGCIIGVITSNDLLRAQPGLIDILVEKFKYDSPRFVDDSGGLCDECNSFSRKLVRCDGLNLCLKCKKKL